ncbi:carbamoyltransferase N-terminal domain-containing protein [Nonomuraea sp. B19D2]|uniref:carbamoyltransferase N-terminal domain-containing protein n=1 Tax=Nonomuraea sp. B19D2 TaxID=3159561 RepID=UPI0032D9DD46
MTTILGLNFHHDTSAALIVDGRLYAAEEERWSGIKHYRRHHWKSVLTAPAQALAWCLEAAGIGPHDIDSVWVPSMRPTPAAGIWLSTEREELAAELPEPLGSRRHALGADFGPGRERITGYELTPNRVDRVYQATPTVMPGPRRVHHSLGHFYRNFATRIIPPGDEAEGSLMALAALGEPSRYRDDVQQLLHLEIEGTVRIEPPLGSADTTTPISIGNRAWTAGSAADASFGERADLAAAVQEVFSGAVIHVARHLRRVTEATSLVFSGGCAFSSHLNGRLAEEADFDTLFIAPAPHDAGTALGAALYGRHHQMRQPRIPRRWMPHGDRAPGWFRLQRFRRGID